MKRNIKYIATLAIKSLTWVLVVLAGCVTPFEGNFKDQPNAVVVQGFISNEPGPHTIHLVRPANYSFAGYSVGVRNAKVYITDNTGLREDLIETDNSGQYKTQSLQGVVGREYVLHFEVDGKTYESRPEKILAPLPIERIYEEPSIGFDPNINQNRQVGWKIFIDAQDPAETGNYYRWNALHYKRVTTCGSVKDRFGVPLYRIECCGNCWDIVRCSGTDCINIANDALINGKKIVRQEVATVPIGCRDKYYLEVEQHSISRDSYVFWKTVRQLLQNTGGVFDVAPSAIPGNVTCVEEPNEQVLGFFSAVGIARVAFTVDRTASEFVNCPPGLPDPPGFPAPCTTCEESIYRTPRQPRYWDL